MNKSLKQIPLPDGDVRYEARIEDTPSEPGTIQAKMRQIALLQIMGSTPGLIDSGTMPFQTMKMLHDGTRWVIELVAVGK